MNGIQGSLKLEFAQNVNQPIGTKKESEEWRPIEGFPDYEISTHGNIKRATSINKLLKAGRPLGQGWAKGYRKVCLCRNGYKKEFTVHSLVLEAFVGPRPPGHLSNHKYGIKTDNYYKNLEWVTPSENNKHAHRIGLVSHQGEKNPPAKLKDAEVWLIKKILAPNVVSQRMIAKMFKISFAMISRINVGKGWNHIKYPQKACDDQSS